MFYCFKFVLLFYETYNFGGIFRFSGRFKNFSATDNNSLYLNLIDT